MSDPIAEALAEIPSASRPLDCSGCHACCHQLVLLTSEDRKRRAWRSKDGLALDRQHDGACTYLDPLIGCTVYKDRPEMCRVFHCGQWLATLEPARKREIDLFGDKHDKNMLASGFRHLPRAEPK